MSITPAELWSWDPEQVDLLLGSMEIESEYGEYGEWLPEAMSEDTDPNNYESGIRYVAVGPKINNAVKVVKDAQDELYSNPDLSRNGHVWGVKRVDYGSTD
jgi:hypothetical protein